MTSPRCGIAGGFSALETCLTLHQGSILALLTLTHTEISLRLIKHDQCQRVSRVEYRWSVVQIGILGGKVRGTRMYQLENGTVSEPET